MDEETINDVILVGSDPHDSEHPHQDFYYLYYNGIRVVPSLQSEGHSMNIVEMDGGDIDLLCSLEKVTDYKQGTAIRIRFAAITEQFRDRIERYVDESHYDENDIMNSDEETDLDGRPLLLPGEEDLVHFYDKDEFAVPFEYLQDAINYGQITFQIGGDSNHE